MANPRDKRIGRTRLKLAAMITEAFPELEAKYVDIRGRLNRFIVDPYLLTPQIPTYASPKFDCCSWDANLPLKVGGFYHVYSWDRMGELVRLGFDYDKDGYEIELSAEDSQ
jgi:hypothetical protein